MRILWLCNIILPDIAIDLGLKPSNKEGWLSGICDAVKKSHDFELGICFPVSKELNGFKKTVSGIAYYGFYEDTGHPETYDSTIEKSLQRIVDEFKPDVVHCFGTEYPHTLAMCRCLKDTPDKILIGIQGILDIYKDHYFDGLPQYVIDRVTFRDFLRKDSLKLQQHKYAKRAVNEIEAVRLAGNVTGRTPFDYEFCIRENPNVKYHFMNETLRSEFYTGEWKIEKCERYSIFLSQGNYPIKGLHTMLEALDFIKGKYPGVKVYVAGDVITRFNTVKDKIKISSYGKYILELIKKYELEENVIFTGSLDAKGIKNRLLMSNVFVCPSSIENSPNSLGEAMILGVPCITSEVGGIPGIFNGGVDGLSFENTNASELAICIDKIFSSDEVALQYSVNARKHANRTHNPETNYNRLLEIYREICK